ncbi:MAG: hypothetical protein H7A39_00600 [Chlamydiales bacterium]|nr:hypothetical protein [Chlamydiales bacterium]
MSLNVTSTYGNKIQRRVDLYQMPAPTPMEIDEPRPIYPEGKENSRHMRSIAAIIEKNNGPIRIVHLNNGRRIFLPPVKLEHSITPNDTDPRLKDFTDKNWASFAQCLGGEESPFSGGGQNKRYKADTKDTNRKVFTINDLGQLKKI